MPRAPRSVTQAELHAFLSLITLSQKVRPRSLPAACLQSFWRCVSSICRQVGFWRALC